MLIDKEEVLINQNQKSLLNREREKRIIENSNLYKIRYLVDTNTIVDGYFALPYGVNEKLPVIFWCRGGFKENGRLTDLTAYITLGEIAQWGFSVFATQYRKNEELGKTDIEDVVTLIQIADEFPFTDINNLGIEGWSRGGLVALNCLKYELEIKCAVIVAGLLDLSEYCKKKSQRKLEIKNFCKKDEVDKISPLNHFKEFQKIPILFIHGMNDDVISYKQSIKMYNALREYNENVSYDLELIDNGTHTLKENREYVALIRKQWYDKYLKNMN
ncbi:MAG: prolyl oligopeptidase family serine peptidase [Ignavibacteria bacterium]|nr:prolyl oligopeptidase family serine peptidase [Ignavibacteria bacterium]